MEDQDYWRMSGIFRDVFLTAVPSIGLWDIYCAPDVNFTSGQGTITVYYSSSNHQNSQVSGYALRIGVVNPNNETVFAARDFTLASFPTGSE
jgi:beta-galactosidase